MVIILLLYQTMVGVSILIQLGTGRRRKALLENLKFQISSWQNYYFRPVSVQELKSAQFQVEVWDWMLSLIL